MREACFLLFFLYFSFPQKQMREAGVFFIISSKTDEACICMSCYTLGQCSMGGVPQSLMIFGLIQEPYWTIKKAIFLKNCPSHAIIKSERCDACIPALNHIKNQYQAPTQFSEERVNV